MGTKGGTWLGTGRNQKKWITIESRGGEEEEQKEEVEEEEEEEEGNIPSMWLHMVGDTRGRHLPKGELGCHEVLESEDYRESHPNAHFHLRTKALTHFHWACLDTGDQDTASLESGALAAKWPSPSEWHVVLGTVYVRAYIKGIP